VIINAFPEDALSIIKKIDANQIYGTIKYEGDMIIYISGKTYKKNFYAYGKGQNTFFCEFTNADDAGTKYLKLNGNLFVYSPDAEEIIPVVGHMLKESVMGSDMSYEDTINNDTLESQYNPTIVGEDEFNGNKVWVLELTGKKKTISYPKRKIWVSKENYLPLKTEYYALSGAILKEETIIEYKKIGNRIFPTVSEMRDLLRKNSKTVFKMNNVELDVKLPDNIFSMQSLEK
jgi:outer membrane lipoprotein-sorting protein